MLSFTNTMRKKLLSADLENGEINEVSTSTMFGFEMHGLVSPDWGAAAVEIEHPGNIPRYSKVKLTKEGLRVARMIQRSPTNR